MKAELLIRRRVAFGDRNFAELVVWRVLEPVPPTKHGSKYRLVYVVNGVRVIGFDNERGKGDHRHDQAVEIRPSKCRTASVVSIGCSTISSKPSRLGEKIMARTEVEVGRGLRAAAAEVAEAWKAAEAGHAVAASDRILFRDWSALCAVLTPKRYELLRHLRQVPETGIRPLARALGRDVRRVHDDVVALVELGLVVRGEDGSLSSEIDAIVSTIRIAA